MTNFKKIFNDIPEAILEFIISRPEFENKHSYDEFEEKLMNTEDYKLYLDAIEHYKEKSENNN